MEVVEWLVFYGVWEGGGDLVVCAVIGRLLIWSVGRVLRLIE